MANDSNNNVIVSRIQHRRGLKQDLPQPLRPGEIGLATDSRQVYIGSDPNDPNAAPYNAISYFENTVGAKDHAISVANNQLIAFQVPYVKFTRGEYNGLQTEKSWNPLDARSIIAHGTIPRKNFLSSNYTVFGTARNTPFTHTLDQDLVQGQSILELDGTNQLYGDADCYVRIGDKVTATNIDAIVTDVQGVDSQGILRVTLDNTNGYASQGDSVTFTPNAIVNYTKFDVATQSRTPTATNVKLSEAVFTSSDVTVIKNGIKLTPESNSSIVDMPSATADYVLDGSDAGSTGVHYLTLRTRPNPKDEVSVCYYSNSNVIQAITGISTGKISSGSPVDSFYTAYGIKPYRHIPVENIRLSTSTGMGWIGLQQKHIMCVADGANIASPSDLSGLGNILIARDDDTTPITTLVESSNTATELAFVATIPSTSDVYSPVGEANRGVYRYNRIYFRDTAGKYMHNKLFDVEGSVNSQISVSVSPTQFAITRPTTANVHTGTVGSGFTSNAAATSHIIELRAQEVDGVNENDWVRVLDASGTPGELHGAVFQVNSVDTIQKRIIVEVANVAGTYTDSVGNVLTGFTSNIESMYFINHGDLQANVDSVVQVYAADNGLAADVANIRLSDVSETYFTANDEFPVFNISSNTFFIKDVDVRTDNTLSDFDSDGVAEGLSGTFFPCLQSSYSTVSSTPVLAIDVSDKTTVKSVISTVNKELVNIPDASSDGDVQIFPLMDYLQQDNGLLNAVYVTQKPAYASIAVGGLPFWLFEDSAGTLEKLGLSEGLYDRDTTVRAKLEQWLNNMVVNRDVTLFANVFLGGTAYNSVSSSTNNLQNYNLTIDETFGEVLFADRDEASDVNYIINSAYSESPYDRAEDTREGTRGIINLKNNMELQTREGSATGEKLVTYTSMEGTTILQSDQPNTEIFALDANVYDTFILDYTMSESPAGGSNKYMRSGTLYLMARTDFTDSANAYVLRDSFQSHWEIGTGATVVEPRLTATVSNNRVVVMMEEQHADPDDRSNPSRIAHNLSTNLKFKYVLRRWSSTD